MDYFFVEQTTTHRRLVVGRDGHGQDCADSGGYSDLDTGLEVL